MQASIPHFCDVVDRIEANSWFAGENLVRGKPPSGFFYQLNAGGPATITFVPTEPLESLLLHVRKLTMNDGPEHLLKVKKALKTSAVHEEDRVLLDLWQKNWRIAFIMPQFRYESAGVDEFMTSYRVYDCFINGRLFHSNSPEYNSIMHGMAKPDTLSQPSLYLQNIFHLTVSNLCLAAVGLKRYIDNKCTFDNIEMSPMLAMEFLFQRKRMDVLDEMYQELNKAIPEGLIHARWK